MVNRVCIKWPDGSYYDGDGYGGTPDGKGVYVTVDGRFYEGLWSRGFSYGLYVLWLEDVLNNEKFKFINVFHAYFKSVEWFINECMDQVDRHHLTAHASIDLAMNYIYAKRLKTHGENLLNDFLLLICSDFSNYSNSIYSDEKAYTCGGRYSFPPDFSDKVMELMLSIEPIRRFKICFFNLDSNINSLRKLMESAIKNPTPPFQRSVFFNALKRFTKDAA